MAQTLIIDTDAGTDDAIAILMALAAPDCTIAAITTVHGNVGLEQVTRNVGIILDVAGAGPIPIFRGAARPLLAAPFDAADIHGDDGLGNTGFAPSQRPIESTPAALAIIEAARANPGATLVALGPLTNVALALALAPDLPQLLGATVIMGGADQALGNASAVAEFNIYADAESAAMVFARGLNPTLLTWEATLATPIPWPDWERLVASGTLGERFVGPIMWRFAAPHSERRPEGLLLPDPLAMAVALDPSCAHSVDAAVAVDTGSSVGRGLTAVDRRRRNPDTPNARIVSAVERAPLLAMLERVCQLPFQRS